MAYLGLVPSEFSWGPKQRRRGIFESSTEIGLDIPRRKLFDEVRSWVKEEIEPKLRRLKTLPSEADKPSTRSSRVGRSTSVPAKSSKRKTAKVAPEGAYIGGLSRSWSEYLLDRPDRIVGCVKLAADCDGRGAVGWKLAIEFGDGR
jgi:hypothetical protein